MGVSFIPRTSGGGSSNITLGYDSAVTVAFTGSSKINLNRYFVSNIGSFDFLGSSETSNVNDEGGTVDSVQLFNNLGPATTFSGSFSGFSIYISSANSLPICPPGCVSYIATGNTSSTAFPALPAVCPATFDLHGLTPTKIQSINWSSVTSFSGTTVNIDLSGQALTSTETSEAIQVAATAGAGNLATMTVNVSGGTNGPLLQPVSALSISLGGVNYEANDAVFVDAIQVGVVNSVGGLDDIIDFTLNSPNAFTNTFGTVTVTSTSGTGAVITVNTLGTNTFKATIIGAGGTVTSN